MEGAREFGRRCVSTFAAPLAGLLLLGAACDAGWSKRRAQERATSSRSRSQDLLPPDRRTTWNPGIPGGIPVRKTVCTRLDASAFADGASDATDAIQKALDACPVGRVVELSAGEFKVLRPIHLVKGVVLRGQGPARTRLKMPPGTSANLVTIGTQWFKFTQSTSLAADAKKGTDAVVLKSNPGLAKGELVVIDEITPPDRSQWGKRSPPGDDSRTWFTRPDRPIGQVMEIAAVDGNRITFTTPFHLGFETTHKAQLTRFAESEDGPVAHAVREAGVEDLYLSGGSQGQGNIWLSLAAYSWIKNVESDFQDGSSVSLAAAFRCVVRDSYVHSTQNPTPGGGGYGISVSWYSADDLIENNIVWNMNKVMVMRASGGGNVIAYNYMDDGWIKGSESWVEVGLNASHMTTPHMELFEGNQSFNFDGDNTWGNAIDITVFRNHLTGKRRSAGPLRLEDQGNRRAIGLMEGHLDYSFLGNVLGMPGQDPSPARRFEYDSSYPWANDPVSMWRLGYDPENWKAPPDPRVLKTVRRGGNFDFFTNEVHWEDVAPQPLPDSLYLSSKPAFFGDSPWPWVDPTGETKLQTLPARARFDALEAALPSH